MNDTLDGAAENQVARHATAVRAAFADLAGPDRELLLEDLEDHLQEVAAEAGGPLSERLGRPEAYAAELRASAGLPASGTPPAAGPDRGCGRPGAPSSSGASGRSLRPTRPAGPWSSSCLSCGPPGGWYAATWPCRRPASPSRSRTPTWAA